MCDCGKEAATTAHFLHCPFFVTEREQRLNSRYERHLSLQNLNEKTII